MDELIRLEETVHEDLRIYRWQPPDLVDPPALFNWMGESPFEIRDQARWRDNISIMARIAVRHGEQDMEDLETFSDAFRDVMDDALYNWTPLGARATWAERSSMRMISIEFNGIPFLAVEFPLSFRLDRRIEPNQ
jgi:hypothetical protein